jgi:iron complex transport system substrate-binding protein
MFSRSNTGRSRVGILVATAVTTRHGTVGRGRDPRMRSRFLAVLAMLSLGLTACSSTTTPAASATPPVATSKTVTDMAGEKVTIPLPIERFASPGPADITYFSVLGVADKLVATDARIPTPAFSVTFAKIAPTTLHIAYPFSGSDVNIEELLKARPQFVFLPKGDQRIAAVKAAGLPVIQTASNTTVDQISNRVTFYGDVFGGNAVNTAKSATDYWAAQRAAIASKITSIPQANKPKVIIMQWHSGDQYIVFGRNVWQDDAITLAGGVNEAAADIDGQKSDVTMEQILKWNPDIIILSDVNQTTAAPVLARVGWSQLTATKNKHVYINPTGIYGFTSQVVEAFLEVQWLARTLNPTLFTDLDMHAQVKHVFVDFYHYNVPDSEIDDILQATGAFHGA